MADVGLEVTMMRVAAIGFACILSGACVNPLPFGPGRVEITLEKAQLAAVPESLLFQQLDLAETENKRRDVVRFDFSSEEDLRDYFRDRNIQFRCLIEGAKLANQSNWASGPYYEATHLSRLAPGVALKPIDGKYHYSAYAFADLSATQLVDSRFQATPLDQLRFSRMSCFVIGVQKAPVLFPRSNELVLSYEDFMSQLGSFRRSDA